MANYCNIDQYLYNYLKGFWVDKKFHGVFPSRTWYNRQIKKFPTEKQNVSLKHILT